MNTVAIRNISFSVPAKWNELSARNLRYLASIFPFKPTHGFALRFLFHCMNLSKHPRLAFALAKNIILSKHMDARWRNDGYVEFGEKHFFQQQLLLAITKMDHFKYLYSIGEIKECLVPKFTHRLKKYYGPTRMLSDVTAYEFYHTEAFYTAFVKNQDIQMLHRLIATLWRPKKNGQKLSFDEYTLDRYAKKIESLSHKTKMACLINYIGLRTAFVNTPEGKIVFPSTKEGDGDASNWSTILMRIAEGTVFGNYHQVKDTTIHDIVQHLADSLTRNPTA